MERLEVFTQPWLETWLARLSVNEPAFLRVKARHKKAAGLMSQKQK